MAHQRRRFPISLTTGFLLLAIAALTLALAGMDQLIAIGADAPRSDQNQEQQPRSLVQAIRLAGDYLVEVTGPDGRFEYLINMNPKVQVRPSYNELRHAGTMYAMAMRHQWEPHEPTREALLRAASYLRERCIRPVAGPEEYGPMLAVWSPRSDNDDDDGDGPVHFEAKLGGAGLALVALVSVERIKPGTVPIEDLRCLGRFILFMQKRDGSFYSKYIPSRGGRDDSWTSLYYPGEAALGLVMLHQLDPSPAWVQGASNTIEYLANSRQNQTNVPADHWALLATAELLPVLDQAPRPIARDKAIGHALQVCRSMLAGIPRYNLDPDFDGCFTDDGRTTPSATRLEGLIAAMSFIPEDHVAQRDEIRRSIDAGIDFLMRAQVLSGAHAGAIPGAIKPLPKHHLRYGRMPARLATEVRIDYVQHALSAFIQYDALRQGK